MGRYAAPLAPLFADFAGAAPGRGALDVGCGPGALTGELVARLGAAAVAAVDPSEPFVAAARERHPGVAVRRAAAEDLPFADAAFDLTLAQLVVSFMADSSAGVREMGRVTRPAGTVAACLWDHAGGRGPLSPFWAGVRRLDPKAADEPGPAAARAVDVAELFVAAGLRDLETAELMVRVDHPSFEEWWEPFTFGIGPVGGYVARLGADRLAELREVLRALVPPAPFTFEAVAVAVRGRPPTTT